MIKVSILADSINPAGYRITTWELTHPRFIHSEFLRHRMLSLNAASSRAIPVEKMLREVRDSPAMFEQYGAANKGMSAQTLLDPLQQSLFNSAWLDARNYCLRAASDVRELAAKQMVNRMLEPWAHMTVIVTGTEWNNFYALRAHPAAQPEFQVLAYRMLHTYLNSVPTPLQFNQWHLPLVYPEDREQFNDQELVKLSAGRTARVSYNRHHDDSTPEKDIKRANDLVDAKHMSPTEHPAMAVTGNAFHGCYRGWKPWRKFLTGENQTDVDLHAILAAKPEWITLPSPPPASSDAPLP